MRMVLVMVHEERSHWGSRRAHGGSRGNVVLVEGHKLMTRANITHIQRANGGAEIHTDDHRGGGGGGGL